MRISEALHGVSLLSVDTAPFIYFVERYPQYVDRMHAIFVPVSEGKLEIITSIVTLSEMLVKPLKIRDTGLRTAFKTLFLRTRNVRLVVVNLAIAERAADLRARHNLKTPDALQVATAIETGCDAFLTNDMGMKRVQEIRVLVLDELELDPAPPQADS